MKNTKPTPKIEIEYIKLERAWLEAYTAWLSLDNNLKQVYPVPKRPIFLNGKILIERMQK